MPNQTSTAVTTIKMTTTAQSFATLPRYQLSDVQFAESSNSPTSTTSTTDKSTRTETGELMSRMVSDMGYPATDESSSPLLAQKKVNTDATLYLNTPDQLMEWMNQRPLSTTQHQTYGHLELSFDLKWFRTHPKLFTKIFTSPYSTKNVPLENLHSVKLITTGVNFFMLDQKPIFDQRGIEQYTERLAITLHHTLSVLLRVLVDDNGPRRFTWIDGNNRFLKAYNKIRGNSSKVKSSKVQTPAILHHWINTSTWYLPYLIRPTWYFDGNEKGEENEEKPPIKFMSIPAEGLHKYIKGVTMNNIIGDILSRNEEEGEEAIIEIRGKVPRGKEKYVKQLKETLKLVDEKGIIVLILVDEKEL
ncbi:hypothetical protein L486_01454 [Kwoniella mangroviensis CBS 10435]|uniref:Uncharacterized protein n=1 Tax=Kwoniella mangroviensis CBS 10435 TaxID=1331196 RepID=A0A1B9J1X6_9TREE|nr:hypothetical protein L486_01454 [Kwoniella mangroviensis CBS 10435]